MPMRILVVEDELKMAGLLRRGLVEEGYAVDIARTGDDAIWMASSVDYDAIVLDSCSQASTASRSVAVRARTASGRRYSC